MILAAPVWANVVYVDATANGLENGLSWTNAFTSLQDALSYAAVDSDFVEIHVAQGRYTPDQGKGVSPGNRLATFSLRNNVSIQGGYAGIDANDPNERNPAVYETILSGDLNHNDLSGFIRDDENSYHVVTATTTNGTAILDGVTVTAGNAYSAPTISQMIGGGIYINHSSPTLVGCRFVGNRAYLGGGVYNSGNPVLVACEFSNNKAHHKTQPGMGGGMYNDQETHALLVDCSFVNNLAASFGGGLCNGTFSYSTVTDCTFIENKSAYGGGMMNDISSVPTITGCTLSNNSAIWNGGAIHSHLSRLMITRCLFLGNTANDGGGIFNHHGYMETDRCVFNGNLAYVCGGGICNEDMEGAVITQSIFWDNIADMGPQIGIRVYRDRGFRTTVRYADVQGGYLDVYNLDGSLSWSNNIDADPLFAEPGHWDFGRWVDGDYHLQSAAGRWEPMEQDWVQDTLTSPCIDAGDPELTWEQEIWPHGERINIGAYGGTPEASLSLSNAGQAMDPAEPAP